MELLAVVGDYRQRRPLNVSLRQTEIAPALSCSIHRESLSFEISGAPELAKCADVVVWDPDSPAHIVSLAIGDFDSGELVLCEARSIVFPMKWSIERPPTSCWSILLILSDRKHRKIPTRALVEAC